MTLKHRSLVFGLISVIYFCLSGCASGPIQTWEGDKLGLQQTALLKAPADVRILSVNGKSTPDYLIDNMAFDYQIKPGDTTIELRYESVWASAKKDEEGKNAPLVARSKVKAIRFVAMAGVEYRIQFDHATSKSGALALADNFNAVLVDATGAELAKTASPITSAALVAEAPVVTQGVAQEVQASATTASPAPIYQSVQPAASNLPKIDALKVLWGSATAEEKKEFLRWAFK